MLKERKLTAEDRSQLETWTAADLSKTDSTWTADSWLPETPDGCTRYAIEDGEGTIFYVCLRNIVRADILFAPDQRKRTAKAVDEFASMIAQGAKQRGYKQLIFESVFTPLIRFLEKRGFRSSQSEFVRDL